MNSMVSPKASTKMTRLPTRLQTAPQGCVELSCCKFARLPRNLDGSAHGSHGSGYARLRFRTCLASVQDISGYALVRYAAPNRCRIPYGILHRAIGW